MFLLWRDGMLKNSVCVAATVQEREKTSGWLLKLIAYRGSNFT